MVQTSGEKTSSCQGFSTIQTGVGFWTTEACDHEALCLPDAEHSVYGRNCPSKIGGGWLPLEYNVKFQETQEWGVVP